MRSRCTPQGAARGGARIRGVDRDGRVTGQGRPRAGRPEISCEPGVLTRVRKIESRKISGGYGRAVGRILRLIEIRRTARNWIPGSKGDIIGDKMVKGSTESDRPRQRALVLLVAALAALALVGMASGLWIHVCVMAVTVGIFTATVTVRKAGSPAPGGVGGAKVLRMGPAELPELADLDEVA